MTKGLFTLLLLACTVFGGAASSQEKPLSANDIVTLLSGNTAVGQWNGAMYRQYFSEDGSTIFSIKGQRSSLGKWRVNRQSDHYESWWERSGWESWTVVVINGVPNWRSQLGQDFAFEVLAGEQLVWP